MIDEGLRALEPNLVLLLQSSRVRTTGSTEDSTLEYPFSNMHPRLAEQRIHPSSIHINGVVPTFLGSDPLTFRERMNATNATEKHKYAMWDLFMSINLGNRHAHFSRRPFVSGEEVLLFPTF